MERIWQSGKINNNLDPDLYIAVYAYEEGVPVILSEQDDNSMWQCRFCKYHAYGVTFMLSHLREVHINA